MKALRASAPTVTDDSHVIFPACHQKRRSSAFLILISHPFRNDIDLILYTYFEFPMPIKYKTKMTCGLVKIFVYRMYNGDPRNQVVVKCPFNYYFSADRSDQMYQNPSLTP